MSIAYSSSPVSAVSAKHEMKLEKSNINEQLVWNNHTASDFIHPPFRNGRSAAQFMKLL